MNEFCIKSQNIETIPLKFREMRLISAFLVTTCALSLILHPNGAQLAEIVPTPKIRDYAESGGLGQGVGSEPTKPDLCSKKALSEVTISVGETNGFYYTVEGYTYSPEKIAVSGVYFNDESAGRGYVNLFLGVESGISFFDVRPKGKDIIVSVDNFNYQRFYFEIFAPYPVTIRNLYIRQYNATAILVNGPSRNAPYYKHSSR